MKVKKWISYDKAKNYEEAPCGGLGGFFNFTQGGMRWKDYIEIWDDVAIPYIEAIRKSVLKKGLRLTGDQHQNSPDGVPLFEDDTIATFSFRAWGDLMAAIWSEKENKDYNYMDFYM